MSITTTIAAGLVPGRGHVMFGRRRRERRRRGGVGRSGSVASTRAKRRHPAPFQPHSLTLDDVRLQAVSDRLQLPFGRVVIDDRGPSVAAAADVRHLIGLLF